MLFAFKRKPAQCTLEFSNLEMDILLMPTAVGHGVRTSKFLATKSTLSYGREREREREDYLCRAAMWRRRLKVRLNGLLQIGQ